MRHERAWASVRVDIKPKHPKQQFFGKMFPISESVSPKPNFDCVCPMYKQQVDAEVF